MEGKPHVGVNGRGQMHIRFDDHSKEQTHAAVQRYTVSIVVRISIFFWYTNRGDFRPFQVSSGLL